MLTKEQIAEIVRCKRDPAFFIDKYCMIQHPIMGLVPFKLYPFQRQILQDFQAHRFNITNKARQTGLSTITANYALWMALFHKKRTIIIISIKDDDAKDFLKKIKTAFYNIPDWLKDEPVVNNEHTLELSTGSVISSVASGSSAARGRTPSLLIIDECAHIQHIADIWLSAYPTLSKGGSAILISTPAGIGNFFYDKFINASPNTPPDKRNEFNQIFVHWTQIPEYRGFDTTTGMSFEEIVAKAYECNWYKKMRPQFSDKEWAQEFEGDFLGSGNTVVDQNMLKETQNLMEEPIYKLDNLLNKNANGLLWIWNEPVPGRFYLIAADVASGDGSDYSSFQIIEITSGEQVAEFQGKLDMMSYAEMLVKVGTWYNTALIVPEITGLGIGLVQKLVYDLSYENLFQNQNELTMKKKKLTYGWITSTKTRPLIVNAVINYFNSRDFKWKSKRLWHELTTFVWHENGKAEHDSGCNDDLVIAMGIAAQNRTTALMRLPLGIRPDIKDEEHVEFDLFGDVPMKKEPEQQDTNIQFDTSLTILKDVESQYEDDIHKWLMS